MTTQPTIGIREYRLYIVVSIRETEAGARSHSNGSETFRTFEEALACYEHKLKTSRLDAVEIYGWAEETGDVLLDRQPTRHHILKEVA